MEFVQASKNLRSWIEQDVQKRPESTIFSLFSKISFEVNMIHKPSPDRVDQQAAEPGRRKRGTVPIARILCTRSSGFRSHLIEEI